MAGESGGLHGRCGWCSEAVVFEPPRGLIQRDLKSRVVRPDAGKGGDPGAVLAQNAAADPQQPIEDVVSFFHVNDALVFCRDQLFGLPEKINHVEKKLVGNFNSNG